MLSLPFSSPRFTSSSNTTRRTSTKPSTKTTWQRMVWTSDLPCNVKGFLQNLAVGWMDAEGGSCFPSEAQIMERLGCSRPSLTRWLRIAVEAGFLERWHYGRGLRNRRYNYQATLPDADEEKGTNCSSPPPEMGNHFSEQEPCPNVNPAQERASEPARPAPEPNPSSPDGAHTDSATPPKPQQRVVPLPAKTTLEEDWTLPDDYRQWAAEHRPDLRDRLTPIAEGFRDFHLSRATRSASWRAEWRRWISRERAPKPTQNRSTTPPSDSRYPKPDAPSQPVSEAVQRAMAASEERRLDMIRQHGIDPTTGVKIGATSAASTAPNGSSPPTEHPDGEPLPPGRSESVQDYAARFEQNRQYQRRRLQEVMAALAAKDGS